MGLIKSYGFKIPNNGNKIFWAIRKNIISKNFEVGEIMSWLSDSKMIDSEIKEKFNDKIDPSMVIEIPITWLCSVDWVMCANWMYAFVKIHRNPHLNFVHFTVRLSQFSKKKEKATVK